MWPQKANAGFSRNGFELGQIPKIPKGWVWLSKMPQTRWDSRKYSFGNYWASERALTRMNTRWCCKWWIQSSSTACSLGGLHTIWGPCNLQEVRSPPDQICLQAGCVLHHEASGGAMPALKGPPTTSMRGHSCSTTVTYFFPQFLAASAIVSQVN